MWLYERNRDNTVRYILGESGRRPLVCIGVNPSTAEPERLDPTLKTVAKLARLRGFDGWLMVNLYPKRATDPNLLPQRPSGRLMAENLRRIRRYLSLVETPTIWAAWGTLIERRTYLRVCLRQIAEAAGPLGPKWVRFGRRSRGGHPHHPLYLAHGVKMAAFDILSYLAEVRPA
jgi:hypothetical protein